MTPTEKKMPACSPLQPQLEHNLDLIFISHMNQHNSPDSGGVSATVEPSSSSSSLMRANDTINGERSSNSRREIEEIPNQWQRKQ